MITAATQPTARSAHLFVAQGRQHKNATNSLQYTCEALGVCQDRKPVCANCPKRNVSIDTGLIQSPVFVQYDYPQPRPLRLSHEVFERGAPRFTLGQRIRLGAVALVYVATLCFAVGYFGLHNIFR